DLKTVEELQTLAPAARELARLAEADPSLRPYYGRLGAALTAEVETYVVSSDWAAAQRAIESVAAVLPDEYSSNATSRLAKARGDYDTRRDRLVAQVDSAAKAGRMSDAQKALSDL